MEKNACETKKCNSLATMLYQQLSILDGPLYWAKGRFLDEEVYMTFVQNIILLMLL